jgi:S1-C subfamily serine protease
MKRLAKWGLIGAIFVLSSPALANQAPSSLFDAIVRVQTKVPIDARTAKSLGTEREGNGVIIDADGLILTIGYLILEVEAIQVVDANDKHIPARFIAYDHDTGFGLIKTDRPIKIEPITLGESSELNQGDPVLVVGHGGTDAVQGARVLSRGEFTGYWEYLLDNAVYVTPPFSDFGGAALIDRDGRLMGIGSISTRLAIAGVGAIPCNMFVPIDLLKPIFDDLINYGKSTTPPRPWLGMHLDEVYGHIVVLRVSADGPAEKAGVRAGDLILTVDQKPVKDLADCYRKIWALGNAGVTVPLGILQGTEIQEIKLTSANRRDYLHLQPGRRLKSVSYQY